MFWVGIDGFTSGSVEQDGTLIECSGGRAFYFTWWEMFPTNSIQVVGSSVRPGDAISASVVQERLDLHAQGHRLHPHREQLHQDRDLLELR